MRMMIIIILKNKEKPNSRHGHTSFPDAALVICSSEGFFSFCFFNFAGGFVVLLSRAVMGSDFRCHELCFWKVLVSELFPSCKEEAACLTPAFRAAC